MLAYTFKCFHLTKGFCGLWSCHSACLQSVHQDPSAGALTFLGYPCYRACAQPFFLREQSTSLLETICLHGVYSREVWMGSEFSEVYLISAQRLEYLGLMLNTVQGRVIHPRDKCPTPRTWASFLKSLINPPDKLIVSWQFWGRW